MGPARSSPSPVADLASAATSTIVCRVGPVGAEDREPGEVPTDIDDERLLRRVGGTLATGTGGSPAPVIAAPAATPSTTTTVAVADLARLLVLARRALAPAAPDRSAAHREGFVPSALSRREQSVLEALADTASRQALAGSLYVSVNTVKSHLARIYKKLGTTGRAETLAAARNHGLLPPA